MFILFKTLIKSFEIEFKITQKNNEKKRGIKMNLPKCSKKKTTTEDIKILKKFI